MLLLDEPTNHLDARSVEWLEGFLERFPEPWSRSPTTATSWTTPPSGSSSWIEARAFPYKGNYTDWLDQKRERLQREESSETARQKAIKRELEWVKQNVKGQRSKNAARIKRFEELNSYEYQQRNETQEIFIPVAERLGNEVIEFKNVSKGYGDRLLIDNLSFIVPPGAIIGIIGPNGAGKSTLFRMIAGKEKPDSGEVKIGHTVNLAVVDQTRKFPGQEERVGSALRRPGHPHHREIRDPVAGLRGALQFPRPGPAEARRQPIGRRAWTPPPREDASYGRQRPSSRRTVERSGR
jgi:sulfate-transporting ATPase